MKVFILLIAFCLLQNIILSQKIDNKLTYICKSIANIEDSSVFRIDTLEIIINDYVLFYKKNGTPVSIIDYKEKISYNFQERQCVVELLENEEKINSELSKKINNNCVDDSIKSQLEEKNLATNIFNKCGNIYINCEKDSTLKINQMYLVSFGDTQYSQYFGNKIINELKIEISGLKLEFILIKKETIHKNPIEIPKKIKIWDNKTGKYVKYQKTST
ncbi:MAG: hypothetical protein RL264_3032 [Bacteroidota bacterium]